MRLNIGFVSTRFAGIDGVSLESSKWAEVLEDLGHLCFWFAGELAENKKIPGGVFRLCIGPVGFLCKEIELSFILLSQEIIQAVPVNNLDMLPVIKSGPLEVLVISAESQRFHKMQDSVGRAAQPGRCAGIGRNFRLHQNYVEWR